MTWQEIAKAGIASVALSHDDDGYISPTFDLPEEDDQDDRPAKRRKAAQEIPPSGTLEDDEALALAVLRGKR